ncbi:DUF3016 domain-containing protein [Pelagicoccus sp. SDUM812005]|uniref:DUF3016 domain-containing protein n=1 Tax=Pelagicoccus sp. SDUM812005 TaxID=3041257 RepID=UPI00280EAAD2|nr:DUF3016 domain-containing protein [Pelagicoccus sp. SDUM812005]MDQ8181963.1 DUF3016 domain-containing protein [Pelagicoccus sp. SDUM812005]
MNIVKKLTVASMLCAIVATPSFAVAKTERDTIRVSFHEPSRYADIDYDGMNSEKGHQLVFEQIRSVFAETAHHWLPPSYQLEVTVLDIDLAGEYEPHRGANFPRVIKEIYSPRIKFDYRVLDADGEIVREGSETLRNDSFLSDPTRAIKGNQEVAYDVSQLIRDWGSKMKRDKLS